MHPQLRVVVVCRNKLTAFLRLRSWVICLSIELTSNLPIMGKHRFTGPSKFIQFAFARVLIKLFQLLPVRVAYCFGQMLGRLLHRCLSRRRKVVADNLTVIRQWQGAGSVGEAERSEEVREVFMRAGANLLSGISFANLPAESVSKHLEVEGLELLEAALAERNGVIVLLAHMGPWEALAHLPEIAAEHGITNAFGALYRPLNNDYLDDWFKAQREGRGTRLFSRRDGFHKPIEFIRDGGMLGILSDQKMRQGETVEFFGCEVSTTPIPGIFHRKTGAPMISLSLSTLGPAHWRMHFRRVDLSSLSRESSREEGCRLCNSALEESLSDSILDGFWFQERFQ